MKNNRFVKIISQKSKHNCSDNSAENLLVQLDKQVSFHQTWNLQILCNGISNETSDEMTYFFMRFVRYC